MRIKDAHLLPQPLAHDFDGLEQVRIVGDNHRHLESPPMRVVQQVRRQVHVQALFLGLDDARVLLRAPRNRRKRRHHLVGHEMAQMDGNPPQGAKGTGVQLLPCRLIRVAGPRGHQRRVIFDFGDGVPGRQQLAEPAHVEPLVGRFAERSVVQIEAVYIDVCGCTGLQTCKSCREAASLSSKSSIVSPPKDR